MARTLNLFESATSRGRVMRQGELVQVIADGGGAFVTTLQEFMQAQKWAVSKTASGNLVTDRSRFYEQIGTLISRPGSVVGTRGHGKYIETLARLMYQAGYDLNEWMLPPALKKPNAFLMSGAPAVEKSAEAETPDDSPAQAADDDAR